MYYVARGKHGAVIGAWSNPQFDTQECVPTNASGLLKYLNRSALSQRLAAAGLTVDDIASAAVRVGVYVDRHRHGDVIATWPEPQRNGHEMVPFDDPALQKFLAQPAAEDAA